MYSTWSQLDSARKQQGREVAQRYGADVNKLDDPKDGPAELTKLIREAAKGLDSEYAAVVASFRPR